MQNFQNFQRPWQLSKFSPSSCLLGFDKRDDRAVTHFHSLYSIIQSDLFCFYYMDDFFL